MLEKVKNYMFERKNTKKNRYSFAVRIEVYCVKRNLIFLINVLILGVIRNVIKVLNQ